MQDEFVKELERGTKILATNLLKREQTKLKLLEGSMKDNAEYSGSIETTSRLESEFLSQTASPKPVPRKVNSSGIPSDLIIKRAESSPQFTRNFRRAPPVRKNTHNDLSLVIGVDDDILQLTQLMLDGKMDDVSKFIKSKDTNIIASYEGGTNQYGYYHGFGTLLFANGDVYSGNFVFVYFFLFYLKRLEV